MPAAHFKAKCSNQSVLNIHMYQLCGNTGIQYTLIGAFIIGMSRCSLSPGCLLISWVTRIMHIVISYQISAIRSMVIVKTKWTHSIDKITGPTISIIPVSSWLRYRPHLHRQLPKDASGFLPAEGQLHSQQWLLSDLYIFLVPPLFSCNCPSEWLHEVRDSHRFWTHPVFQPQKTGDN